MRNANWTYIALLTILVPGILPACSFEHALKHEETVQTRHTQCVACHRTSDPSAGDGQVFTDGLDPSAACLDCHEYRLDHHPVDVAPEAGFPKNGMNMLPLFEGQVRCLTCHQAHRDAGRAEFGELPKLLRGGPYEDRRAFCFACHDRIDGGRTNPHKMLSYDGSIRDIDGKPVCLVCHSRDPAAGDDPADMRFNADIAFVCWRCHSPMQGGFLDRHFHVIPRKMTRMVMRKSEKDLDITLPLARDGMMTCSTCHNPHQAGVLAHTAIATGADAQFRLRVDRESICRACHLR